MLILATDMARHGEILVSFKDKIEFGFDYKDKEHVDTVICFPKKSVHVEITRQQ